MLPWPCAGHDGPVTQAELSSRMQSYPPLPKAVAGREDSVLQCSTLYVSDPEVARHYRRRLERCLVGAIRQKPCLSAPEAVNSGPFGAGNCT